MAISTLKVFKANAMNQAGPGLNILTLQTDNGREFMGKAISKKISSAYKPCMHFGLVETSSAYRSCVRIVCALYALCKVTCILAALCALATHIIYT